MEHIYTAEYWDIDHLPPTPIERMEFNSAVFAAGEDYEAVKAHGIQRIEDEWSWGNLRWSEWEVWNGGDLQGALFTFTLETTKGDIHKTKAFVMARVHKVEAVVNHAT